MILEADMEVMRLHSKEDQGMLAQLRRCKGSEILLRDTRNSTALRPPRFQVSGYQRGEAMSIILYSPECSSS